MLFGLNKCLFRVRGSQAARAPGRSRDAGAFHFLHYAVSPLFIPFILEPRLGSVHRMRENPRESREPFHGSASSARGSLRRSRGGLAGRKNVLLHRVASDGG